MVIKGALYQALMEKAGSQKALSRLAIRLDDEFGPMSPDEARLVIAHDLGVKLGDYGVSSALQDRIRTLKASGASLRSLGKAVQPPTPSVMAHAETAARNGADRRQSDQRRETPASQFLIRNFHAEVIKSSRRLFGSGHSTEAVVAALRSVNNRVKRVSGLKGLDGAKLMNHAFSEQSPAIRLNSGTGTTEADEQTGLRYLMLGAMLALRNPRIHEDQWQPDHDADTALECLGYASLLHRFLDRCEAFGTSGGTARTP